MNIIRTFKKNKRDYTKAKVDKLQENSKNKHIMKMYKVINGFKKGYQPRPQVTYKDDDTIVAHTPSIFSR